MFGYIVCNKEKLAKQEIDRYQGIYCGLCKSLEHQFGQLSRMSLNYDMTFLILFLSSLYEPPEEEIDFRCSVHPLHMKKAITNKYTDYAADITIALSYYKCLDDWQDEHKHLQRHYAEKIEKNYRDVKARCPRQCKVIETEIAKLTELERSAVSLPDDAVNCFGRLMAELFVYDEDFWSSSLRSFGYELGRFIYLMDATMDYKKDLKIAAPFATHSSGLIFLDGSFPVKILTLFCTAGILVEPPTSNTRPSSDAASENFMEKIRGI